MQFWHVVIELAPTVFEYLFAAQLVHGTLPLMLLYFPASHATHGPPSGPVYPALQGVAATQAANDTEPAGEVFPSGHILHGPWPTATQALLAARSPTGRHDRQH